MFAELLKVLRYCNYRSIYPYLLQIYSVWFKCFFIPKHGQIQPFRTAIASTFRSNFFITIPTALLQWRFACTDAWRRGKKICAENPEAGTGHQPAYTDWGRRFERIVKGWLICISNSKNICNASYRTAPRKSCFHRDSESEAPDRLLVVNCIQCWRSAHLVLYIINFVEQLLARSEKSLS